jgi:hypothetical protein
LKKAKDLPKLTPEEQREWINLRIMNQAKSELRHCINDRTGKPDVYTLNDLTDRIYEGLVSDWVYNKQILEACRSSKVNRQYVSDLLSYLFDADGNVIQDKIKERSFGGASVAESPKMAYSEDGRAQYSLTTINELHKAKKAIPSEEMDLKKKTGKGKKKKASC